MPLMPKCPWCPHCPLHWAGSSTCQAAMRPSCGLCYSPLSLTVMGAAQPLPPSPCMLPTQPTAPSPGATQTDSVQQMAAVQIPPPAGRHYARLLPRCQAPAAAAPQHSPAAKVQSSTLPVAKCSWLLRWWQSFACQHMSVASQRQRWPARGAGPQRGCQPSEGACGLDSSGRLPARCPAGDARRRGSDTLVQDSVVQQCDDLDGAGALKTWPCSS